MESHFAYTLPLIITRWQTVAWRIELVTSTHKPTLAATSTSSMIMTQPLTNRCTGNVKMPTKPNNRMTEWTSRNSSISRAKFWMVQSIYLFIEKCFRNVKVKAKNSKRAVELQKCIISGIQTFSIVSDARPYCVLRYSCDLLENRWKWGSKCMLMSNPSISI